MIDVHYASLTSQRSTARGTLSSWSSIQISTSSNRSNLVIAVAKTSSRSSYSDLCDEMCQFFRQLCGHHMKAPRSSDRSSDSSTNITHKKNIILENFKKSRAIAFIVFLDSKTKLVSYFKKVSNSHMVCSLILNLENLLFNRQTSHYFWSRVIQTKNLPEEDE